MFNALRTVADFTDSLPKPTPDTALKTVLNIVFSLAGIIAVIVIVVGGLQYSISNGDPNKAAKAKNTIIYALVGLIIAISAFSIVNFVIGKV